jgi:hypothetical protein
MLDKEAGEVTQALRIVEEAFGQGEGFDAALARKGWQGGRSMICVDDGQGSSGVGWGDWRIQSAHAGADNTDKIE